MAEKRVCKWRKAYFISDKCARCKNRRKCGIRILYKWTSRAVKAVGCVVILVALVALINALGNGKNNVASNDSEVIETEIVEMADASSTEVENEDPEEKKIEEKPEAIEPAEQEEKPQVIVGVEIPVQESPKVRKVATEEEKLAMGKVVWKESRGEPYDGKVAVAAVVLNRLDTGNSNFGAGNGEILSVISYPGAFASIKGFSDDEFKQTAEYDECMKAVEDALSGSDPTREHFENGALFFYSLLVDLGPEEAARREGVDTYVIGNHAFHITLN